MGNKSTDVPKNVQIQLRLLLQPQNKDAFKKFTKMVFGKPNSSMRTTVSRWAGLEETRTGARGVIRGRARLGLVISVLSNMYLLPAEPAKPAKPAGEMPLETVAPVKKKASPSQKIKPCKSVKKVKPAGKLLRQLDYLTETTDKLVRTTAYIGNMVKTTDKLLHTTTHTSNMVKKQNEKIDRILELLEQLGA